MKTGLFIVNLSLLVLTTFSYASEISINIPFNETEIRITNMDSFMEVTAPGFPSTDIVGFPSLPVMPVRIAMPTGCCAVSIEIIEADYRTFRTGPELVLPTTLPVPVSLPVLTTPAQPDPAFYGSDEFYPDRIAELSGSSVLWGIPVAYATVYPVRWNPSSGELQILSNLQISVQYHSDNSAILVRRRLFSSELRSQEMLRDLVVNPLDVSPSGASFVDAKDLTYGQYVIITIPEYETAMQELADWKTSKGIPTSVYTTDWIQGQYSFLDLPQDIRAFLTDCRDEGVDYVLIAGDDSRVVARRAKLDAGSNTEYSPCDLYFADINDSYPGEDLWDSSGNHVWGEAADDVDYHPDLWVGRATVASSAKAELFVNKVLFYEHRPSTFDTASIDYFESSPAEIRMGYTCGDLSGYGGSYGGEGGELISDNYIPAGWDEEKLYEMWATNSTPNTIAMISDGAHHVYHANHGGITGMYTNYGEDFTVADIMNLTNITNGGSVTIWNTMACLTGAFDEWCCGDGWINSEEGGGFGAFNARYGWYFPGAIGEGMSEHLCQAFYNEYFNNNLFEMGIAHATGLDDYHPPSQPYSEYYDWCVKEYNLFGDPELPMWTLEAEELDVTHTSSISGNDNILVDVSSGGNPLVGARVCLQKGDWQTGEIYEIDYTDASGQVGIYVTPSTSGTINIYVWAHNHDTYDGTIDVTGVGIGEEEGGTAYFNNLNPVSPSPAFSSTVISFSLAQAGFARVDIFDITGRIVTTLIRDELTAGSHNLVWNLEVSSGTLTPSGLYHVRVSSGSFTASTSMIVIR
ncbi:MAG: T9SS type A sorting domain-containing protein [Candidatus Aegiribacteria sp.]|nr:T9SS type A sorting domain-containing protein [Candidatus Aegiribacteria sp.]